MIKAGIAQTTVKSRNDTILRTKPIPPLSSDIPSKRFDFQLSAIGTAANPKVQITMSAACRYICNSSNVSLMYIEFE